MKIVADKDIPFLHGLLESKGIEVVYLPDYEISPDVVRDADGLMVRTRTRCGEPLLGGSAVKVAATCTIGTDHFDLEWCGKAGIVAANAPGCNAPAVAQWVLAAAAAICGDDLRGLTLGVVGVGNVGSIVERWAEDLGMNVLRCDPPRAEAEGAEGFVSLDEIARRSDIVTFHTPLTLAGDHPSYHLADKRFFDVLERRPVVLNASRGGVVDERAALEALAAGRVRALGIDTWEGEPHINLSTLAAATVATQHIAGYSRPGKIRATQMALNAVTDALGIGHIDVPEMAEIAPERRPMTLERIRSSYDIMADTAILKASPDRFEQLRNTYFYRPEP